MKKTTQIMLLSGLSILFFFSPASAQVNVIDSGQLQERMTGVKRSVLIDVRSTEEYRAGHIPGSINIPAERISEERSKLPRDKSVPLIFYCRGAG